MLLLRRSSFLLFFNQQAVTMRTVCIILLLCQFHTSFTSAAVAGIADGGNSWSGGGGGAEEEEEQSTLGDRSALIIRQQDAEEGERWEESAWTPQTSDMKNNDTLCKKPMPPENGYIKGNNYNDGGVVRIHCEPGYTLRGPRKLTCIPVPFPGAPGIWLPEDEYDCLPSGPRVVEIRTLGGSRNEVGPSYTVLNGDINGHDIDKTRENEGTQSTFEDVMCPKPPTPKHGRLEGTDYSLYATVRISCDEGYSLIGPDRITCLPVPDPFHHEGIWEPQRVSSCHARPPSTLPLILAHELALARLPHQQSPHRRTDTLPDATRVEGLQTLCSLPKVIGPCRASIPRFYFNTTQLECLPFTYGGCHGNDNNFETISACQTACR